MAVGADKVTISIVITKDQERYIKELADLNERSVSQMVRIIIDQTKERDINGEL